MTFTILLKYFSFLPILAICLFFLSPKYSSIKKHLFFLENDFDNNTSHKLLWLLIGIYFLTFGAMSCLRYLSFHSTIADLGSYENRIWQIALNGRFEYLINGHFTPILFVHAFFYKCIPSALTLLLLQTITIALASIPLFYLSSQCLKNNKLSLVIVMIFFLFTAVEFNNLFDFHPDHIFIVLMISCFYFLKTEKKGWFFTFAVLASMVKEPYLLSVAALGLYAMIRYKWYKTGLGLFMISMAIFLIHAKIILPHYFEGINPMIQSKEGSHAYLGNSLTEILKTFFFNPLIIVKSLINLKKVLFVYVLFAPLLFIPIFSPWTLILSLPSFAIPLLSLELQHYAINNQYSASLIPFIFVSFVYGLERIVQNKNNIQQQITTKGLNIKRLKIIVVSVFVVTLHFNVVTSASPISCLFWGNKRDVNPYSFKNYIPTKRDILLKKATRLIPEGMSVSAQNSVFTSQLAKRDIFFVFPEQYKFSDYIILDEKRLKYINNLIDVVIDSNTYDTLLKEIPETHSIIFQKDGIHLFKKHSPLPLSPNSHDFKF